MRYSDRMRLRSGLRLWRSSQSRALPRAVVRSEPRVFPGLRFDGLRVQPGAVSGILLAIDRGDMRRVEIVVGSSDAKLFFMQIDPFPQLLTGGPSVGSRRALYAHDIGRQPVTI